MTRGAAGRPRRWRAIPRALVWVSFGIAVGGVVAAWLTSSRVTVVVPRDRARDFVALFGDAWREPAGEFRVTGGRMDGGVVHVFFAAPDRGASMTFEHVRARRPVPAGALVIAPPGSDVVAIVDCTPSCDAVSMARLTDLAGHVLRGNPGRLWIAAHGFAMGRERRVASLLVAGLGGIAVLLGVVVLWRARPVAGEQLRDALAVVVATAMTTAVLGVPSVANWYTNFLPATGGIMDAADQNGMAGFFLQAMVRGLFPWTDRTLFGLNLFLHGVTGGVFYLAFRALRVERAETLLALALWAVQPVTVRVGWSDAQHVQVTLLFALLLLVWLRAQDEDNWPERLLAPVLAALLPAVRLEASVLAPLPLLFGPFVGNRSGSRRLLDAAAYAGLLGLSVAAVFELFVRRYDMPLPDPAQVLRAAVSQLVHLRHFGQLVFVDSGMANWVPLPTTVLLGIGAVVLAVRQPRRLVAIVVAFLVPQLLLDRLVNAEGMVGARYFMPVLALLMLVAASALTTLAAGLQFMLMRTLHVAAGPVVTVVAGTLGVAAVAVTSVPLYGYQYSFQGEYRFLREALRALPANAVVLHLPVREDDHIRNDPDCCLDLPNSPLALAFPGMRFETVPIRPDGARLPAAVDASTYYYEGAICHLAPISESEQRNPGLSAVVREQCATLARDARLEPVATARVPSEGFWPFLPPGGVPVRLYRVGRQ